MALKGGEDLCLRLSEPVRPFLECFKKRKCETKKYGDLCSFWHVAFIAAAIRFLMTVQILQVGLPYLRTKAQEYYEDLGGGIQSEIIEESQASRQARVLADEVHDNRLGSLIL